MNENTNTEIQTNDNGMDDFIVERAKNAKVASLRLVKYLSRQKLKFLGILISVLISSLLTISAPLVIGKAIDQLYTGIKTSLETGVKFNLNVQTMGKIIGILLIIYISTSLFTYLQQYVMAGVAQTLTLSLRKELTDKLNRLPLSYYDSHKKGDILSRLTNDLERIADSLQEGLLQLITSAVTIIAAIFIMLTISPVLTLIILSTLSMSMLATMKLSPKIESNFTDTQQAVGELNSTIEEAFTGELVIKAFSGEARAFSTFQQVNQKLCDANRKSEFAAFAISPFIRFLGKIGYCIVAVIGGIFAVNGTMTLGSIQAIIQYIDMCSEPMTEISYILTMLQSAVASAERVFEILDETEEIEDAVNHRAIKNPNGKVVFEHVAFGYSKDCVLMKDINIDLNAGDKIAIVGPTGAGKTTLVNLLMRFYEIQRGCITIDGVNINTLDRGSLRTMFGMVLQDTWLFHGSIQDNIAYGRPAANLAEIILAAKSARIDHFIRTLPQGYQTILDEDGSNISQGQKQLLTIARAILANPSILILDEATSSVDTRTEVEIQKAMKNLMKDRTSFVIAHRLSTIRDADLILVMNNGTIIEQGKHEELLEQKGFYEQLYNSQFANKAPLSAL
jgi:ATP-binding cassette subfamily B protein